MSKFIRDLKSPHFKCKGYYLMLQPVHLLSRPARHRLQAFAIRHWKKYPEFMHRLYWISQR